jgi:hypothetical protein
LGEHGDGPFFRYVEDRKAKGFTALLMSATRGYGDEWTRRGERNEGGLPFDGEGFERLNPAFFAALDQRMKVLWRSGFVVAMHPTWFGKNHCAFDHETAKRLSTYLAVRYGAYNCLWSLSGEYQYAMRDCGWSEEQVSELGRAVAAHNPYHHPLSIHPSGRIDWPAPHGAQSSRAFHHSDWLDHHWLQAGQKLDMLHHLPQRIVENRALAPHRPVFASEGYYERATDLDHAYHTRWQAWTAMLNGAAGFGNGTNGIFQFYDPDAPERQTGRATPECVRWQQALELQGTAQLRHLRSLLDRLSWWELEPCREQLMLDGETVPMPTGDDISPPHMARTPAGEWIVYLHFLSCSSD